MTTYAYKDGVIAYDGRCTSGDFIIEDDIDKKCERNGVVFFITGAVSDDENFLDVYFNMAQPTKFNTNSAIVWDGETLWLASIDKEEGFWKRKLHLDRAYATGSGSNFAIAAMDLGKSAREAVEYAITRDCKSGGLVREFIL